MAIINEGIFDSKGATIIDAVKNFFTKDPEKEDSYLGGSISDFTKDLVMTFPVLCDDTLDPKTAGMISKINEKNAATMLRMLFSAMNFSATDGMKAIAAVHKNIKTNANIYDVMDALDKAPSSDLYKRLTESYIGNKREIDYIKEIKEQAKKPCKAFPVDSLSENSLNDYTMYNINGKNVVRYTPVKEADDVEKTAKIEDLNVPKLSVNDAKKINEMEPTLMEINFYEKKNKDDAGTVRKFLAGVKSRLIRVEANDIIERLVSKNKSKINFLNLIRATTGETKFFRDFIFAIDQAKIDSKNAAKKGPAAEMWNILAARSTKNNSNKLKKTGNDASAITTLVLSQETVNSMKKYYKFDLERVSNAKMILDAYNLMGIIICDDSVEVAKSLYSGNDLFEETAYAYLEKEATDNYKKIVNLIGKTNTR